MQPSLSIQQTLAEPIHTQLVVNLLASGTVHTRSALVRKVCEALQLRDPKGRPRIATTAKALRDLEAQGLWTLPKVTVPISPKWNATRLHEPVPDAVDVPPRVEDVRGLRLVVVKTREHLQLWNELMIGEHPLHECRLVGRQLRYLIASDHGWLGGIGFGSAALYLKDRDVWVGWSPSQRMEHLPRVLNMNRFLIRPPIQCSNLASHALGACARQVVGDFKEVYGLEPWMLESFVEREHYAGTCYKAANWIQVGQTKGRGRNGGHKEAKGIKDIFLYPLVESVPDRVGVRPPPVIPLDVSSGLEGTLWADQEFGGCDFGDPRRTSRLVKIVSDKAAQPSGSYSQAAGGNRHVLKSYYRFLNTERQELSVENMIHAHRNQTIRRMKQEETVLIVQDTTELNFTSRPACQGLGELGSNQTGAKSRGLDLHSCLAVGGESGLPLGVLRLHGYAPQSAKGKDPGRPIQERESFRWLQAYEDATRIAEILPETQVISVADREGDMFELFDLRRRLPGKKADLLVRAKWNRSLDGSNHKLFEELAATPLAETVGLQIPRQREHRSKPSKPGRAALPARKASVEIRFKEVMIRAPHTAEVRDKSPIKLWVIYVKEPNPPKEAAPIRWLLLTSVPIVSIKQAQRCLGWYCRRWRIEEWHRVMKSGCKILEHQNHSAAVLLKTIAIDAVIAWRIMLLTLLGREVPGMSCESLFDPVECRVLERLALKKNSPWVKP